MARDIYISCSRRSVKALWVVSCNNCLGFPIYSCSLELPDILLASRERCSHYFCMWVHDLKLVCFFFNCDTPSCIEQLDLFSFPISTAGILASFLLYPIVSKLANFSGRPITEAYNVRNLCVRPYRKGW